MGWLKAAAKAAWPVIKKIAMKVGKYAVDVVFQSVANWAWEKATGTKKNPRESRKDRPSGPDWSNYQKAA
jgi:hypothetical protein